MDLWSPCGVHMESVGECKVQNGCMMSNKGQPGEPSDYPPLSFFNNRSWAVANVNAANNTFDSPNHSLTTTTMSQYHVTPPPTMLPTAKMSSQRQLQPTTAHEPAPATTDHKHPHERRPVPTNRNRLQQAELRQAHLLPTTHLSNTESRCHVAVGDVPSQTWNVIRLSN